MKNLSIYVDYCIKIISSQIWNKLIIVILSKKSTIIFNLIESCWFQLKKKKEKTCWKNPLADM